MSEPKDSPSISRASIDYAALDRVVGLDDDQVIADHPPEHILESLRLWLNFE